MALEGLINGSAKPREQVAPTFEVFRLRREDPRAFSLWPQYEARVRAFLQQTDPDWDTDRLNGLMNEILTRWINQPQYAAYAAIIEGDSPFNRRMVGHFLAWAQQAPYGGPYINIYQVQCDMPSITRQAISAAIGLLREFKEEVNQVLKAAAPNAPLVEKAEHWAIGDPGVEISRRPAAWIRFVPELKDHSTLYHVMRFKI